MAAKRLSPAVRRRALEALDIYRQAQRRGFRISLREVAQQAKSSIRSMRRVAGAKAIGKVRGDWAYFPADDKATRVTSVLAKTPDGPRWVEVEVRGLHQASKAGRYARAIQDGNRSKFAQFRGSYITDVRGKRWYFVDSWAEVQRLDREGLLRIPGLRFTGVA
jgi:hypothetical protein